MSADPVKLGLVDSIKKVGYSLITPPPIDRFAESKESVITKGSPTVLVTDVIPIPGSDIGIKIDRSVREKYRDTGVRSWDKCPRTQPIVEIVIHGTASSPCTQPKDIISWMVGGERKVEYQKNIALFHYLNGRNKGEMYEVLSPEYWTYHSSSGANDWGTIGIENINTSSSNKDPYTEDQYYNLFELIFGYLLPKYPTISRLVSHNYNSWKFRNGPWGCPGQQFDWKRVSAELTKRGYTFKEWSFPNDAANGIIDLKYNITRKL